MNEVNDLIKKIGNTIVNSIPDDFDWVMARYNIKILITYSQSGGTAIDKNGNELSLSPNFKPIHPNFSWQLREAIYNHDPGKGAWYEMDMNITRDGKFDIKFDYDQKPGFNIPLEDLDYIKDHQKFPRTEEVTPIWLKEILDKK